jgi:hypothetical protein
MINLLIERLVQVLSGAPQPSSSIKTLGLRTPVSRADIPAITISATFDHPKGRGLGSFIRAGNSIVQNRILINFNEPTSTGATNLKSIRIWPLPLRKNPNSNQSGFTEQDIQIKNITDPSRTTEYHLIDRPVDSNEFAINSSTGEVTFGKSQNANDRLEIVYWTVTWRDDITAERFSGTMGLEIWAADASEADTLFKWLDSKVSKNGMDLRQKGFMVFLPRQLEPSQSLQHQPAFGAAFPVWKQKVGYHFVFEGEEGGEISSGAPIGRVDVKMDDNFVETFSVPNNSQ